MASGPIWLGTQQGAFTATNKSAPSMATYRNHAYILWLGDPPTGQSDYQVYYTTNASGAWKTRLLSSTGPGPGGESGNSSNPLIAVDPTLKRLYAVWTAGSTPNGGGLVLYTSDDEGATWQGPTTLVKNGPETIAADLALAVGGGKAAVAFHGNPHDFDVKPACQNSVADVLAMTYNGTAWSPLQDVSSCVGAQANGFRTQRLAYDETTGRFSLVAEDDSGKYRLWYAQSSGATWSTPTLIPTTHVLEIDNYNGDYRIAAAGGATYVVYPQAVPPGKNFCCVDIFLGAYRSDPGWTTQRVTQDPLNCQKFDVALAARPSRIALAYRWGGDVRCAKTGGPHNESIHVLTGLPGHLQEIVTKPPVLSDCLRPVLSTDGDLFRVLQVCANVGTKGVNLFYTPEFLDVVGPTTHISGLSAVGPGAIRVAWSAQDPTPGSGVAYSQVQVRVNGGAWQSVVPATQSLFIVYKQAQAGKTYTFRVRSRDKVNNWGAWVTAATQAT